MELPESNNKFNILNQERIQNSFRDYFLSIFKEIPEYFNLYTIEKQDKNLRYLNDANIENKKLLELSPIKEIDPDNFIDQYSNYINLIHKKPNKIPHFTNFEKSEIKLLNLLKFTHLANKKIDKYLNLENNDHFTNNHLVKINNIIKSNPDLIGYIYILKWLQKIITLSYDDYNEDESIYNIINNRRQINGVEKDDPIALEEKCTSNNDEEYNNLMKQFSYCLFKGNIYECQLMCEQRKIEEFGNIFSGGCPLFDKIISNENDFINFDNDLISPSMFNKEYKKFIEFKDEGNYDNNEKENNIYGNSLYILWFKVMYENANYTKNNTLLNYLFRLISGNYNNYELNINNIYEYLYINILNLLHSKIFFELTQNPKNKMIQYHYIESETFKEISQTITNDGRNINNIIDSIIQNNNYPLLLKNNPFLWLELSFIKLFFIKIQIKENIKNNKKENNNELFTKYFEILNNMINRMKKGNDSLNIEYNEIINNEREFNYSSLNNRKIQTREFYDMVNLCLYRAYFSSLTTFYSIEKDFIDLMVNNDNGINLKEKIEQIYILFDQVYCDYIKQIINLNNEDLDFDLIIYITTYMFNIKSIIFILTEISHYIKSNQKYQEFITFLKALYGNYIYNGENLSIFITKVITDNSNLLLGNENNNFNSIDDALNYYIQLKMESIQNNNNMIEELSDSDKYKINQILCLFKQTENKQLNKDTSYSYLLKLFIKFLNNYKYKEAYELKYQLKDYIYDEDAPIDELIVEKISGIEEQINKINSLTDSDEIQFHTILTSRYLFIVILDCFYFYANKIIIPYNKFKNKNSNKNINLEKKYKEELSQNMTIFIKKKIFILNKLIKLIIGNEIFFNYTLNYYGEDTKNEYKKLLADWAFQGMKWICNIFNMNIIDRNKYDSLDFILDDVVYNKDMIHQYYLMDGFNFNNAFDSDSIINKKEKKLFDIMNNEQKKLIIGFIYQMAKINRPYLTDILDDSLVKKIKENKKQIIYEVDFDFDE